MTIELFPFGSVPFKTYLPNGDIDLTAITHPNTEKDLAKDVCTILEGEKPNPKFRIRNVQYICAQVKVIKFSVNNIAVDISFNQRAAICSLFFLEQVNQLIGKQHLFKRSIILIKAWCFYESRILGAHCGLISTYALETLVLHVINLFHSSLHSPLEVLCRFLDYYSTFDWDNYCVSIYGSVALSALPNIVVNPKNDGDNLLLSREVMDNCREAFSDSVKGLETGCEFHVKYLNILDPLKEHNNLGRSVSKGNFHRIKCAISFAARQLQEIFQLPGEIMGLELENFFVNTLRWNGTGLRPDAVVPVAVFGTGRGEEFDLCGDYNNYFTDPLLDHWCPDHYARLVPNQSKSPSLPSRVQNISGTLYSLVPCRNITTYTPVTDAYFFGLPVYHVYASQLFAFGPTSNRMWRSRGTGTYIPAMVHHSYRESRAPTRVRNHETRIRGQLQRPLRMGGRVENSPELAERENSRCPDLSLNEFPSLSGINRSTSSDVQRSCQSSVNYPQAEDRSIPVRSIDFGTSKPSSGPAI
ncbi:uncharacterized protein LOC120012520 isoform X2 [Tripterygium wilfordii]|uniref:uncharacterized protein LOC120012520 isoform X2 n=1 Tax=Tripterygium wilfordii TaxID=458696 RepID=UPI0018F8092D|nr:uncharacterized protein LOC120012520 isoform X2 [Tripterygium wilfordii]